MKITKKTKGNLSYALAESDEIVLSDVQSALDFIATVRYETGCDSIVINKSAICEEFFDLKTRIAGELLEKFVQYHARLAIVGDYSGYTSKALRDFIYESNKGRHVFFTASEEEALSLMEKGLL